MIHTKFLESALSELFTQAKNRRLKITDSQSKSEP